MNSHVAKKISSVSSYRSTLLELEAKYVDRLHVNQDLTREIVSFQANKKEPFYRWLKFKEGFSSSLVQYCINLAQPKTRHTPRVLDPFGGSGTTLTTATRLGWRATGIELLPVGTSAMKARLKADTISIPAFEEALNDLKKHDFVHGKRPFKFPHLRITEGAFPKKAEQDISSYVGFLKTIDDVDVNYLFWFACLSVLEEISYTRKDGQYLRWDSRSKRKLKSSFDKGQILDFRVAILRKLDQMLQDMRWRNGGSYSSNVNIFEASCLEILPTFPESSFELILTSPPYCNRYDYTRTYALELAFLGYDEVAIKTLRQTLLSATVENKSKKDILEAAYRERNQGSLFYEACKAFENQIMLQTILSMLYHSRDKGKLNNPNIPTMVENYFFELTFVIFEMSRILSPGGKIIMVNDNVQYQGKEIPVDLILSDIAESSGLKVENIWVLPRGKGNSSQQMGVHGRKELRKCVYVWSKSEKSRKLRIVHAEDK